jgi:hypothetical protein
MAPRQAEEMEDEDFMRSLTRCEEDRRKLYPGVAWSGGYRWFRSNNIICLEQIRAARANDVVGK